MRLNANGAYMIEQEDTVLEVLSDEREMEALLHYTVISIPDPERIRIMGADWILAESFIWLANDKLEELQDELYENKPKYTEEQKETLKWLKEDLARSIAEGTGPVRYKEKYKELEAENFKFGKCYVKKHKEYRETFYKNQELERKIDRLEQQIVSSEDKDKLMEIFESLTEKYKIAQTKVIWDELYGGFDEAEKALEDEIKELTDAFKKHLYING